MTTEDKTEISDILSGIPAYSTGFSHGNDTNRIYELVKYVYMRGLPIYEVEDYIKDNMFDDHPHKEELIRNCSRALGMIIGYLKYTKEK